VGLHRHSSCGEWTTQRKKNFYFLGSWKCCDRTCWGNL